MHAEKLVIKARQIAQKAHEGQFRHDKITPYFNHVEAVAIHVGESPYSMPHYFSARGYGDYYGLVLPYLQTIGYLHDILEDTTVTIDDLNKEFPVGIVEPVILLTKVKDKNWNYVKYLTDIKLDLLALVVKWTDLWHNLSDLKPGDLRDKYELSKWFLEN